MFGSGISARVFKTHTGLAGDGLRQVGSQRAAPSLTKEVKQLYAFDVKTIRESALFIEQ